MRTVCFILDLLFPPKCPFCRKLLENPRELLCQDCQGKLPWLTGEERSRKVDFMEACYSPLAYSGRVTDAIHCLKFSGVRAYARPLGVLTAQCLQDSLKEGADLLTWAPISKRRLRERGYDQAELLARAAASELSLPCLPTLIKHRHTGRQSDLKSDSARRSNALGAYLLYPGADIKGKTVVVVDDVVTSGATLSECARILNLAGAAQVYGLTLAQARGESFHKKSEK